MWGEVGPGGRAPQAKEFDFVVIAQNGKCANRLLLPAGVPLIAAQMQRLKLSAIWCSMVAFEKPLPVPKGRQGCAMEGAFVEGLPALAWMGNNTAKLKLEPRGVNGAGTLGNSSPHGYADSRATSTGTSTLLPPTGSLPALECWTLFSTAAYGRRNKVPQERIPADVAERVKGDMLRDLSSALGLAGPALLPPVVHHRVQLWGAALPLNAPGVEFICDGGARVAMCGDWLLAPSVEAAALSGMSLAEHISKVAGQGEGSDYSAMFSVGLHDPLRKVAGAEDIGKFA